MPDDAVAGADRRPSTRNSVCLLSMPRRLSTLRPPMARPCRLTPGSARSASSRLSAPRASIWRRVPRSAPRVLGFQHGVPGGRDDHGSARACSWHRRDGPPGPRSARQGQRHPARAGRAPTERGVVGEGVGERAVEKRATPSSSPRPACVSLNCFGFGRRRGSVGPAARVRSGGGEKPASHDPLEPVQGKTPRPARRSRPVGLSRSTLWSHRQRKLHEDLEVPEENRPAGCALLAMASSAAHAQDKKGVSRPN